MKPPFNLRMKRDLKSLNHVRGKHWSVKNAEKTGWFRTLHDALTEHTGRMWRPPSELPPKRRAVVVRILGPRQRSYDYDNLVGGAKPLIDAGTRLGLWRDDSPEWLEVEYRENPNHRDEGPAVLLSVRPVDG